MIPRLILAQTRFLRMVLKACEEIDSSPLLNWKNRVFGDAGKHEGWRTTSDSVFKIAEVKYRDEEAEDGSRGRDL